MQELQRYFFVLECEREHVSFGVGDGSLAHRQYSSDFLDLQLQYLDGLILIRTSCKEGRYIFMLVMMMVGGILAEDLRWTWLLANLLFILGKFGLVGGQLGDGL